MLAIVVASLCLCENIRESLLQRRGAARFFLLANICVANRLSFAWCARIYAFMLLCVFVMIAMTRMEVVLLMLLLHYIILKL